MPNKQHHNQAVLQNRAGSVSINETCTEIDTPVLPSPEVIAKLNQCNSEIVPWLLKETSLEAENRRKLENKRMDASCSALRCGQVFGLIIGLAGIIGGALVAIYSKSPAAGASIASVAIGTLAVTFATRKNSSG